MKEILEVVGAFSKFGITGLTLGVICYVVWLDGKKEKARLEQRNEEMKQNKKSNDDLVNELKNVAYEVGESTKTVIKLVTSNELSSKYHTDSLDRFENQIISIHERVNEISKNTTEIRMIVDKCHK